MIKTPRALFVCLPLFWVGDDQFKEELSASVRAGVGGLRLPLSWRIRGWLSLLNTHLKIVEKSMSGDLSLRIGHVTNYNPPQRISWLSQR